MAAFSDRMLPEVVQTFWAAMQRGEFITDAAAEAGTYRKKGARWLVAEGGVRPRRGRHLQGRCLSFAEREEIALGRAGALQLSRCPPREVSRKPGPVKIPAKEAYAGHDLAFQVTTAAGSSPAVTGSGAGAADADTGWCGGCRSW